MASLCSVFACGFSSLCSGFWTWVSFLALLGFFGRGFYGCFAARVFADFFFALLRVLDVGFFLRFARVFWTRILRMLCSAGFADFSSLCSGFLRIVADFLEHRF